ncbi:5-(carboxyamino)imidazole ribonucleotide mutase [Fructilactobacillus cliffordii]|uniref:N5-carboxyaminoimidazole ribonucleotide mutase n=1 Tax=Fructilactobacillus cliffordii TaxID=2940299 RepID=A0A9Q8ZVJ6_9LACO|nr:5-(carboxyamino)imidazole ribonucleotide mutase [Fructilactobacillus cliffordii]USS89306.1 5-(carboxyamino)imidazole ribonucleotide mutase [Fructilactobacillus cliffordii]
MEKVWIIMGSKSDWATMKNAAAVLTELQVPYAVHIISAHRTPDRLATMAEQAEANNVQVVIAGAGGAAHLPGMFAANTVIPVVGVPVESHSLHGMDSLLSIVQMPAGVSVATMAIGVPGAKNAGHLTAQILGLQDPEQQQRVRDYRRKVAERVVESEAELDD